MSFIYLASPYSANPEEFHQRALDTTARLIAQGELIYSPIVHCHPIHLVAGMPKTFDFWMKHNFGMLSKATALWVLTLPGWEKSTGVRAEIEHALQCQIPIRYINEITDYLV
jgi:hypothetical protein